jgi:hypothetical protein
MRAAYIAVLLVACATPAGKTARPAPARPSPEPKSASAPAHPDYLYSPELNRIMKMEINAPFNKLAFYVFHSGGEFDYIDLARQARVIGTGIEHVRTFPKLPVTSAEGREVFMTFVDTLARDSARLESAIGRKDDLEIQRNVSSLSRTCNSCHQFFRLDISESPVE